MGWASGSWLMRDIIGGLKGESEAVRRRMYQILIPALEGMDWDTQDECFDEDPVYDEVLRELHPEWFGHD